MTSKEKAVGLIERLKATGISRHEAIQCALIVVDEMKEIFFINLPIMYNFWVSVESELKNIQP